LQNGGITGVRVQLPAGQDAGLPVAETQVFKTI
jgi:hypothetical protein